MVFVGQAVKRLVMWVTRRVAIACKINKDQQDTNKYKHKKTTTTTTEKKQQQQQEIHVKN